MALVCRQFSRKHCQNLCYFQKLFSITEVRLAHKYAQADVKPNRYSTIYRDLHGSIDEESTAKDFVYALKRHERDLLQIELQRFNVEFGIADAAMTTPPTRNQLRRVCLHNALPFIGFGFLDNFLMIIAGEYIELKFGAMLGISTMAAAALGNWISDLAGVQSAHYVEVVASWCGVKAPPLSPQQVDMRSTRWASNIGKAIGVSIGCILGMLPLLFFEHAAKSKKKQEEAEASPT